MKRLALLATLVAVGTVAFAQTREWTNNDQPTNSYGPAGPTGPFQGQADATQWVRWPERGPGIDLGGAKTLTEISVYYLSLNEQALTGNETMTVQIYSNDGSAIVGDGGTTFNRPGTLLYTSAPVPVYAGDRTVRIPINPSINAPAKITFTLKFQGGVFDVGPFDPAINPNKAGGRFWGGPTSGLGIQGPTGVLFRKVFTAGGPSGWSAQERPATFPLIPFCFAASIWSGNTALITTPYDLGDNLYNQAGFIGVGDPNGINAPLAKVGNTITFTGDNRKISQIDFGYYADTTNSTGNPTFVVKLVKTFDKDASSNGGGFLDGNGGNPDEGQVIWQSAPQPIPLGKGGGGSGELQTVTLSVPNVVVPANFCWIFQPTGIGGNDDDLVGPGVMWSPLPGDNPNQMNGYDGTAWGKYVFGTTPYQIVADLGPIKFTGAAVGGTERLAPVAQTVNLGKISSGNLASLAADDNNPEVICKFFVPNLASPFVSTILTFNTTKPIPTGIQFEVKAKWNNAGAYQISLLQHNYSTNADDTTLVYTNLGGTYTVFTGTAGGTLTNYVSGSNTSARILVKQTGPSTALLPCVSFEYANQLVTG